MMQRRVWGRNFSLAAVCARSALAFALAAAAVTAPAVAAPRAGEAAPAFTLPTADGKTLSLASLRGKGVYLNFFATWCGPCNDEAPFIAALSQRYQRRGLVVLGVDELENRGKALEFIAKYRLPYRVVIDESGSGVGEKYGLIGLPAHVFIDRSGKVKRYRLGEMSRSDIESAIKSIL